MNRRRALYTVVTAAVMLLVTAVPSHGGTAWATRANATGKGAGDMPTMTMAAVSLAKPAAVRAGVATPKGVSKRVLVEWMLVCDNDFTDDGRKRVTTGTDGSVSWVTVADGSANLGAGCLVMASGDMNNRTQLRLVVQSKSR